MRFSKLFATALGSWAVGTLGGFLVWIFIYSMGGEAARDETYGRLLKQVVVFGGLAGLVFSLWVGLMLGRAAPGFVGVTHFVAMLLGFVGGSVDWRLGLWGYFGGFGAFAFLALLRRTRRGAGGYVHRDTSGGVSGDSCDGGWFDWGGGCDGGDGGAGGLVAGREVNEGRVLEEPEAKIEGLLSSADEVECLNPR